MSLLHIAAPLVASCLIAMSSTLVGHNNGVATGTYAWTTPTSLPAPRARPAVAVGHDGNFYVFGGFTGSGGSFHVTNSTFVYNPRSGRWSQGTTMPIGLEGAAAVTLPDGRIAVMGGGSGCFGTRICTIYRTAQVYNPKTHAWCLLAPMHTSRYLLAATLGANGRIYAIGGWNGQASVASVESYDSHHNKWTPATSLPQPEDGMAATMTRGRIVVIGGSEDTAAGGANFYNNLFIYNGHRWNSGSPMPTPRSDLAVAVNATGQVYAIGGYNPSGGYLARVEAYNPATGRWVAAKPLPRPLSTLGAATGPYGRIYTFGGYNGMPQAQVAVYGLRSPASNPFTS